MHKKNQTQTTYLLRRDVKGHSSQIHLHKVISARQNKEKSWKDAKTLLLFFVSSQQVFQQFRPSYTGKALVFLCINYFLMFVFTLIKFNINFSPPNICYFEGIEHNAQCINCLKSDSGIRLILLFKENQQVKAIFFN